jgi:hypothetical protein
VAVTFLPAGEARLDLYTDAMILDIGPDTFVVPLDRLADLTAHRRREVVVSRRYWGDAPGVFEDVEQGLRLRRSQTDRSLMLTEQGTCLHDADPRRARCPRGAGRVLRDLDARD